MNVEKEYYHDEVNISSLKGTLPKTAVVNAKEVDLGKTFGDQAYDITLEANDETIQQHLF